MKFNVYFDTKNGMVEPTCTRFNKYNQGVLPVHKIICDYAVENVLLEKVANGKG